MAAENQYVLGRGRIFLANYLPDTETPGPFRHVGNTPELNITGESETLDHTNSDEGINQVDAQVQLSVSRSGSFVMDSIVMKNMALFLFGEATVNTQLGSTADVVQTWDGDALTAILDAGADADIFVGVTADNPSGIRKLDAAMTTLTTLPVQSPVFAEGTDWEIVDAQRGIIRLLTFPDPILTELELTYRVEADAAYDRVVSGSTAFEGALKFLEDNPLGPDCDWTFPKITLSPNGDLSLKGDEWRNIPITMSVQKPANSQSIYMNGRPQ